MCDSDFCTSRCSYPDMLRSNPRCEAPGTKPHLKSALITSQMPVDHWHELIGDPTLADAILDRLIHNAHRVPLKGESLRKKQAKLAKPEPTF